MDFKDKIKFNREKLNLTMNDLAKLVGVSAPTIQRYESGEIKNVRRDKIAKLAKALDVSPSYLMGWEEYSNIEPIDLTDSINIPVVGRIPAGIPVQAIEDIIEYIDIPKDWAKGDREFVGLKVDGDSMYPLLLDGDTVVIQVQPSAETGDICACYVNGYDATLKRISLTESSITLKPENPNYPPMTYIHPGEVTIVGKVVEVRRKL